jgi:hypothetical protein
MGEIKMNKNILIVGLGVLIAFAFMIATDQTSEVNASGETSAETASCSVLNKREEISVSKGEYRSESTAKRNCERALKWENVNSHDDCWEHCTTKEKYECLPGWQGAPAGCETKETSKECVKWGRRLAGYSEVPGGTRPKYEKVCEEWAPLYTGTGGGIAACNCLDIPKEVITS